MQRSCVAVVRASVPSRGMHAKRAQAPPPPPPPPPRQAARPSGAKPVHAAPSTPPPASATSPPTPSRAEATRHEAVDAEPSPASAVLAKNISRIAGTGLKGADLLGKLLTAAEKQKADVAATAAAFSRAVSSPSLAGILEEAGSLNDNEIRDFISSKLPALPDAVRRILTQATVSGAGASSLTDAVKLLEKLNGATNSDNLVLVMSSSEARAKYWSAELKDRLAQQFGNVAPEYLYVSRSGDVDEFELPDGTSLSRDNRALETTARGLMATEITAIDRQMEGVMGRLQSLQPWVDPAKAAEELELLSRSKYARQLDLQLLRPKA